MRQSNGLHEKHEAQITSTIKANGPQKYWFINDKQYRKLNQCCTNTLLRPIFAVCVVFQRNALIGVLAKMHYPTITVDAGTQT